MNNKIYVASKAKHAPMWKEYRKKHNIISTWIDEAGVGETKSFSGLWKRCIKESLEADVLIAFKKEDDEPLKGAYCEIGAHLSKNKDSCVIAVGLDNNTFTAHKNVFITDTLDKAFEIAELIFKCRNFYKNTSNLCSFCFSRKVRNENYENYEYCRCGWEDCYPDYFELKLEKLILEKKFR